MIRVGTLVRSRLLPCTGALRMALVAALLLLPGVVPARAQEPAPAGSIRGQVLAAATRQPLAGAAVVVLDLGLAEFTGGDGRFVVGVCQRDSTACRSW